MVFRSPIHPLAVELELFRRPGGLYRFIRAAWNQVEAVPFVPGWHIEEICAHLEAVSRGELDRLIINVPPGCAKSLTVSVFWPVWDWAIRAPWRKWMFASFDVTLSQRDALRAKDLVQSEWFQTRLGFKAPPKLLEDAGLAPVQILTDTHGRQNTATIYWTSGGGLRFSTSVHGKSTGWHSHIQVVDDPTKPKDVQGGGRKARTALEATRFWWSNTMASRHADPENFARVIIMQRLHANDLAGHMEREGGYTVLRLPMEFRSSKRCVTPWGGDRRTVDGELLWPERFGPKAVATIRKEMGPMVASAQLDQDPSPEGGAIFKRAWFTNTWTEIPAGAKWLQSWDFSFTDGEDADYVVGQVWAAKGGEFFLVDQVRDRMDVVASAAAVKALRAKWPQARTILVEKRANGAAVQQMLRRHIPGIVFFDPRDSKEGRANAVAGYWEAGNVFLPDPARSPWVHDFVEEHVQFPKGQNDDQVDAGTQALLRFTGKTSRLAEAMDNV